MKEKKRQLKDSEPNDRAQLRTWIDIDRKAIAHNYRVFRKLIGKKTKFLAVVKSNAYGHNLVEFASEMEKLGVDWLGVDSLAEGLSVRQRGVRTPILVLGYTLSSLLDAARDANISVTISSFSQLDNALKLKPASKKLRVHIKVDTGMHRQGFQIHEAPQLLDMLASLTPASPIVFEGLYTHFAEAKDPRSSDGTLRQVREFNTWITQAQKRGIHPIVHASATGGALLYSNARFDMVRIGIGCYGLWPSQETEKIIGKTIALKPVLSWHAIVSEVKNVRKGERIGYDFTELLTRDSIIAIVPIGYWHGLPRALSGKGRVLIHGKSARILGRVSMDMIVVDVTDIPHVAPGDEVTLIGRSGRSIEIKADEIARFSGTSPYEIVTRLNPLIERFYRD